ncbi:hypothetical protein ACOQFV_10415 [Nocardiopsis changdeensis]|uniref:Uncharacterized protein n=1 Tax=Nocardiopsis changdeensis TaxID=2831969 RepID=A0ABX8BSX8_9ACTN|nr:MULTISPECIES: hypothetical protein [Nocardiopsis]QUX25367.1 hypothetical protein KGD84_14610 [Nocardiopsis changdeensis]QYX35753.1 hypothetical protein K1J57_24065 [Nocardiopsis sp. MT53]
MRSLSDTDPLLLPRRTVGPGNPYALLPAGRPHGAPHGEPPSAGPGRSHRSPRPGPADGNRGLRLACASAATAAALLGLVEFASRYQAFGGPGSVGHCLLTGGS